MSWQVIAPEFTSIGRISIRLPDRVVWPAALNSRANVGSRAAFVMWPFAQCVTTTVSRTIAYAKIATIPTSQSATTPPMSPERPGIREIMPAPFASPHVRAIAHLSSRPQGTSPPLSGHGHRLSPDCHSPVIAFASVTATRAL